eukprot:ctg_413.g220
MAADRRKRKLLQNRESAKRTRKRLEEECNILEEQITYDERLTEDLERELGYLFPFIRQLETELQRVAGQVSVLLNGPTSQGSM